MSSPSGYIVLFYTTKDLKLSINKPWRKERGLLKFGICPDIQDNCVPSAIRKSS